MAHFLLKYLQGISTSLIFGPPLSNTDRPSVMSVQWGRGRPGESEWFVSDREVLGSLGLHPAWSLSHPLPPLNLPTRQSISHIYIFSVFL